jgi:glycerate kinase
MRILIANDKFKGSLEAEKVARHIQNGLENIGIASEIDICPIADGGEGTTGAVTAALRGEILPVKTVDAQGRPISAKIGWVKSSGTAVLEMSAASGIGLVSDLELKPLTASTLGTGILLHKAAEIGAKNILIGIGGSATNDGGLGVAIALGFRFYRRGHPFQPTLETLLEVDHVAPPSPAWPIEVTVACDVANPLLGPEGATRVYGPQKGVTDFTWFEQRLEHLAGLAEKDLGIVARDIPGAGAAGGLGFGLIAFANGKLVNGFHLVARHIGLESRIAAADLIITGEGRIDGQSLNGKGPVGVAEMARRLGKKTIGIAGSIDDSPELRARFELLFAVKPAEMALPEAMRRTGELIEAAVRREAAAIRRLAGIS